MVEWTWHYSIRSLGLENYSTNRPIFWMWAGDLHRNLGQMPPRVTTAPTSWDPEITSSGPCNQMVHREPTNEAPTGLWVSLLNFPPTDRKKKLFFLLPLFFICSDSHWLKEKPTLLVKIVTTFTTCMALVFLLTQTEWHSISPSFLHCDCVSYWALAPSSPTVWKNWHLFAVKICSMTHGSVKKVPDVSFQETPVTKLQLTVARDEVHFSVPSKHIFG